MHCSFTVDNELDYVMYNNQLLNVSGGDTGDWQQEKEITFQSCNGGGNPGTLEIQALYIHIRTASSYLLFSFCKFDFFLACLDRN